MPQAYFFLLIAVIAETIGTTALQASHQFTRLWPSVIVVIGYGLAFYFMAITLRYMPVGIVYAMWSGLGIVFITAIGYFIYKQAVDFWAIIGLSMIIGGIAVINLLSKTTTH